MSAPSPSPSLSPSPSAAPTPAGSASSAPLLRVGGLTVHFGASGGLFGRGGGVVQAVNGVSFDLARGETLSLVGESGCGKTTIARSVIGLGPVTDGKVELAGRRIDHLSGAARREAQRRMQFVFQDPFASLNPAMRVRDILAEPLRNFGLAPDRAALDARVAALLDMVRLPREAAGRFPHEFSGGQRQRIGIARALAPEPDVLICDEAVSALDVSVQAQIVNLFRELQDRLGLSILFISHDMAVVEHVSHRVAVLYMGEIVETGTPRALFEAPRHPYTRALISAVPTIERMAEPIPLEGEVPSPLDPPSGCRFRTRCPLATEICAREAPASRRLSAEQTAACHHIDAAPRAAAAPDPRPVP